MPGDVPTLAAVGTILTPGTIKTRDGAREWQILIFLWHSFSETLHFTYIDNLMSFPTARYVHGRETGTAGFPVFRFTGEVTGIVALTTKREPLPLPLAWAGTR